MKRLTTGRRLTTGQCATLACLWEVSIPKPGNVHRGADFEDLTFYDFINSAVAIAPAMNAAVEQGVGTTILNAVNATQKSVSTNTNLGTILLMAPLAAAWSDETGGETSEGGSHASLQEAVRKVLHELTPSDATLTYEAICAANPGGMGEVADMDVAEEAPTDLIAAMQAAQDRDLVARQYCNDFAQIFDLAVPSIEEGLAENWTLPQSVIHTHLRLMTAWPDSLIARKCGEAVASEAATRARVALDAGLPTENDYQKAVADLDFWLRSDGHRRNPGTTADLIAASLFVMLRQGTLEPSAMTTRETELVTGEEN